MSLRGNILTVYLLTFGVGVSASRYFQNASCGVDKSPIDVVFEGLADIETYPWLGYLFYPMGKKRYTTVVVLVTRQIVIGTATEIDKLPKNYFRARAKVVIGSSCSGPLLAVRDYTYHPDYGMNTYSALAMVQLELDGVHIDLHPICPPPTHVIDAEFYAMTLSDDCNKPLVRLYEMQYVDPAKCKTYYRKSGLDMSTFWPTHTACAKAQHGGECLWRSGAALVLRQGGRWNLVGFGVHGPGCSAPARFLDYGMYHEWVRRSVLRIGRPTITRLGDNQVILRRSLSNIQRFGPCDREEMKMILYRDITSVKPEYPGFRRIRYNMTIYANVEYSCVMFNASNFDSEDKAPSLRLRRWCAGPRDICSDFQRLEIDFYVEINFVGEMTYSLSAYGRTATAIDTRLAMWYVNNRTTAETIPGLEAIQELVQQQAPMTWYSGEWHDLPDEDENVTTRTSAPL